MKIEIQSENFTTQKDMTQAIKEMKASICDQLGYNREQIKIPNGLITLYGITEDNTSLPITDVIGNFKDKLKNKTFTKFFVYCNVETK